MQWQAITDSMRRFSPSRKHHPLLQPIFWCVPHDGEKNLSYADQMARHAANAEAFSASRNLKSGCAASDRNVDIPEVLGRTNTSANSFMTDRQQQEEWKQVISRRLKVPTELVSILLPWRPRWHCKCQERGSCEGRKCFCTCIFCRTENTCACKEERKCICSDICSCACPMCHLGNKDELEIENAMFDDDDDEGEADIDVESDTDELLETSPDVGVPSNASEQVSSLKLIHGKLPKSCDPCWSNKQSCDGQSPCKRCQKHLLECTYNHRDEVQQQYESQEAMKERLQWPTCLQRGCSARVNPMGNLKCCSPCVRANREARAKNEFCRNASCTNYRHQYIAWCSLQCYITGTPRPARCQFPGCKVIIPLGLGKKCEEHYGGEKKAGVLCILRQLYREYRER